MTKQQYGFEVYSKKTGLSANIGESKKDKGDFVNTYKRLYLTFFELETKKRISFVLNAVEIVKLKNILEYIVKNEKKDKNSISVTIHDFNNIKTSLYVEKFTYNGKIGFSMKIIREKEKPINVPFDKTTALYLVEVLPFFAFECSVIGGYKKAGGNNSNSEIRNESDYDANEFAEEEDVIF